LGSQFRASVHQGGEGMVELLTLWQPGSTEMAGFLLPHPAYEMASSIFRAGLAPLINPLSTPLTDTSGCALLIS
jgi:hypothetical protein